MFNKNQAGLALGSLFALMHFLWIVIVVLGAGQNIVSRMHSIHFLSKDIVLLDFSIGTAILGVVLAFISGYVIAWLFAAFYNKFAKK